MFLFVVPFFGLVLGPRGGSKKGFLLFCFFWAFFLGGTPRPRAGPEGFGLGGGLRKDFFCFFFGFFFFWLRCFVVVPFLGLVVGPGGL